MNNSNVKHNRDIAIDVMKGIGILLVLLGHVCGLPPVLNHVLKSFRMPMFFIIAGCFSKSYSLELDLKATIKHYAKRLIIPYLVTMLATCLWFMLKAYLGVVSWGEVLSHFISIFWADVNVLHLPFGNVGIGVVWFLLALFWAKVLLLFITKWEKWVLPISVIISVSALLLHNVFPYSVWCISIGCVALPFVAFGWWIRRHHLPWYVWGALVMCWVVSLIVSKIDIYSYVWDCYPLDVLGACGGTFIFYYVCKGVAAMQKRRYFAWLPHLFIYLGTISLAIMCVHDFEIASHLGNHLRAAIGWDMPMWGLYVWRYSITIVLAIVLTKIPKIKSIFV